MPCSHCGAEKIYARGWCAKCYGRYIRTGSLEYSRKYITHETVCAVEGCHGRVVAKHMCDKHYRATRKHGAEVSPFAYGHRQSHPLYGAWCGQRRVPEGRVEEWNDFWAFVGFAGEKPGENFVTARLDIRAPWGPDNFRWLERHPCDADKALMQRQWRERNPLKAKSISLKRQYGIGIHQYLSMYDARQGRCDICGDQKASFTAGDGGKSQTLVVDHCHTSGIVRGLLCANCNKALGALKDSPKIIRKAAEYIERFSFLDTPSKP